MLRQTWLIVLALCISSFASASTTEPLKGAVALRINQRGLSFLAREVQPLIPTEFDIPDLKKAILSLPIPGVSPTLDIVNIKAELTARQLNATLVNNTIQVHLLANVKAHGDVHLQGLLGVIGSGSCQGEARLLDVEIRMGLVPSMTEGRLDAQISSFSISFDKNQSSIELFNCTSDSILDGLAKSLHDHFLATIDKELQTYARDTIQRQIVQKLAEVTQISGEMQGFVYTVRLDNIKTDDQGIALLLGASIEPAPENMAAPPCLHGVDLTPPAPDGSVATPISIDPDRMFGFSLSRSFLNQALYTAWRMGVFCLDSQTIEIPTLAPGLDQLGVILASRPGVQLKFSLRPRSAPQIAEIMDGRLAVVLSNVELTVERLSAGGISSKVVLRTNLSTIATPWVNPARRNLSLELQDLDITKIRLALPGGHQDTIPYDPARLALFLNKAVMPLLRQSLSESPISPAVLKQEGLLVEMRQATAQSGFLSLSVDGFKLDPSGDTLPPNTKLLNFLPKVVGPGVFRLAVQGQDDATPDGLLRYRARLDGGAWNNPQYGGRIDATVFHGVHKVEVAAMDHAGNIDPTPILIHLEVDNISPKLRITSWPLSTISGASAAVEFEGEDDRTPPDRLVYEAVLYSVPDEIDWPKIVDTRTVAAGDRRAEFNNLERGIYVLRVTAKDEVGNVTSQDVTFAVSGVDGGCMMARGSNRGSARSIALLAVLMLGLALQRRRSS